MKLSSIETDFIGDATGDKRAVFYDEMCEPYRVYMRSGCKTVSTVQEEAKYHLNNLRLLSFYFDIIFIHTAYFFNTFDPFTKRVVESVVGHSKFKSMLSSGVVRICGWGGKSADEMFGSAFDFSSLVKGKSQLKNIDKTIKPLFEPQNVCYRAEDTPDSEAVQKFIEQLEKTEIIRSEVEFSAIKRAVEKSQEQTNSIVGMVFFPALDGSELKPVLKRATASVFITSWLDHINETVPGVYNYVPFVTATSFPHVIDIKEKQLRSFLYSPRIFESFLQTYFGIADYNKIMACKFDKVMALRNGDWSKFREAYHSAIENVSVSISDLDFEYVSDNENADTLIWAQEIGRFADACGDGFDVNAFIQSLATLTGILCSVPLLGPSVKVFDSIVGKRVSKTLNKLSKENGVGISPYINKIGRALELQVRVT